MAPPPFSAALFLLAATSALSRAAIVKRWPLSTNLPDDDLSIDGSAAGPLGAVFCSALEKGNNSNAKNCHNPNVECNICYSRAPHVFYVTWCADTRGHKGISCSIDLGYRSPEGARYGQLAYSVRGLGSTASDFSNASTTVFPDSPYPFSHFAGPSGANVIATVFQLSMAENNLDGDNLPLTQTSGFCCRATFSGGKTVTGSFYLGDLDIRSNGVATPTAPPAPYAASAVAGAAVGGALLGAAISVAGITFSHQRATGVLPAALTWLARGR